VSKLILDAYCKAGGAAIGYHRAGLFPVGIDTEPQPNYPFPFLQMEFTEAMTRLLDGESLIFRRGNHGWRYGLEDFAAFHGSPPCQLFCMYRNLKSVEASTDEKYVNMIPDTRRLFVQAGKPYIIENVPGARAELDPRLTVQLCGTTFGIPVRRHRLFELGGWELRLKHTRAPWPAPLCRHYDFTERIFPGSTNRPNGRTVCNIGEYRVPLPVQKACLRLDDIFSPVTMSEVSEMIPPCMSAYLGEHLLRHLRYTP